MILVMFAIYDSAISTWNAPIYARNKGEMIRMFSDACNEGDTKFAKHPSDYVLFEIGSWNDDTCEFVLHKAPLRLGVAMEFVRPKGPSADVAQ